MLSRNGLQDVGCKVWSICRKSQWLKLAGAFEDRFFPGKGGGGGTGGLVKRGGGQHMREGHLMMMMMIIIIIK